MPRDHAGANTALADEVRGLLRKQLEAGWTVARVCYEMERLGHKQWTASVVQGATKDRFMTLDECVSLLGIFRGNATIVIKEIERIAQMIERTAAAARDRPA